MEPRLSFNTPGGARSSGICSQASGARKPPSCIQPLGVSELGFHHFGLCQGDRPPCSEEERCCRPPWSNRAGRRDCGSAQEAATISQKAKGDWPVISNRRPSDERQATSTFAPGSAPTPFDLHSPAHVPLGSPGPLSACLAPRAEQDVSGPLSLPTSPCCSPP